jgi:hypothetical protein
MKLLIKRHRLASAGLLLLLVAGCQKTLVFTTETKFGLDISQNATQTPQVTMGYERAAAASFPVAQTNSTVTDAGLTNDAYAVLADISIYYNPVRIFTTNSTNQLRINQFFATGLAAQNLATNTSFGEYFGGKAGTNATNTNKPSSNKS